MIDFFSNNFNNFNVIFYMKSSFFLRNMAKTVTILAVAVCFVFSGCECPECEHENNGLTVPGVVENITVTTGDGQVDLTWGVPLNDGGSPITGYELTRDNWATKESKTASERSHTFSGLSVGSHTFKVRAVNEQGAGAAGVAVTVFTVKEVEVAPGPTVPGAVENLTVTVGVGEVSLEWEAPSDNGGSAITGYELTMDDWANKVTKTASQLSHTFTGLVAGVQYTFKLRAVNAQGEGVTGIAVTVVTECNCEPEEPADGMLINGVVWAEYNVDAPGVFVTKSEDFGMLYRWNRKIAWASTGAVTGWEYEMPAGTTWEKSNDPSPTGWRVPTREEFNKLLETDKVNREWITQNGKTGYKFTDKNNGNSIFLPAVGYRDGNTNHGNILEQGINGYYWSSTESSSVNAYYLLFWSGMTRTDNTYRYNAFSIRSVKE